MIQSVMGAMQDGMTWFQIHMFWRIICIVIVFVSGICEEHWSQRQRNITVLIQEYQVRPELSEYLWLHFYRAATLLFLATGTLILFVGV